MLACLGKSCPEQTRTDPRGIAGTRHPPIATSHPESGRPVARRHRGLSPLSCSAHKKSLADGDGIPGKPQVESLPRAAGRPQMPLRSPDDEAKLDEPLAQGHCGLAADPRSSSESGPGRDQRRLRQDREQHLVRRHEHDTLGPPDLGRRPPLDNPNSGHTCSNVQGEPPVDRKPNPSRTLGREGRRAQSLVFVTRSTRDPITSTTT